MAQLYSMHVFVDSVGPGYWLHEDTDIPFVMKNIGDATIYIAVVDSSALDPGSGVDYSQAYPLDPGESVQIPAKAGVGPNVFGFTTRTGQSKLAILGIK